MKTQKIWFNKPEKMLPTRTGNYLVVVRDFEGITIKTARYSGEREEFYVKESFWGVAKIFPILWASCFNDKDGEEKDIFETEFLHHEQAQSIEKELIWREAENELPAKEKYVFVITDSYNICNVAFVGYHPDKRIFCCEEFNHVKYWADITFTEEDLADELKWEDIR